MQEETPAIVRLLEIVALGCFAAIGGAVKYTATAMRAAEPIATTRFWKLLAANMLISSFCGIMGVLMVSLSTDNWIAHGLAAGCFGYLGTQGMDIILLVLKQKLQPTTPISAVMPVPAAVDPAANQDA